MTDKVKKIRKEVERLKSQLLRGACSSQIAMETRCKEEVYNEVLAILESLQENPVCAFSTNRYTNEDRKILCDGCEEDCKYSKKDSVNDKLGGINNALVQDRLITSKPIGIPADAIELVSIPDKKEPVSDGCIYNRTLEERQHSCKYCSAACQARIEEFSIPDIVDEHFYEMLGEEPVSEDLKKFAEEWDESLYRSDAVIAGANWQKQKDSIPVSEDLGECINELSKQFPEVSFAKLSRIAVRVAKWQKQKTISKACEWLNKNFTFIHPRKGVPVCAVNLNSFKDALNDEEV